MELAGPLGTPLGLAQRPPALSLMLAPILGYILLCRRHSILGLSRESAPTQHIFLLAATLC